MVVRLHLALPMAQKKPTISKILLTAGAVVLFWRGAWGLMDLYIFPNHELLSYGISMLLGVGILLVMKTLTDDLL